jgi:antibiotic biosynthesis monooxygenase (ABM) superfamily enzyme
MRKLIVKKLAPFMVGSLLLLVGCVIGRETAPPERTLMHVFAYTPVDNATQQDYAAFETATRDMVGKIPGLRKVWVGKLREPTPAENDRIRTYGVAMEFDSLDALAAYAHHPVHAEWNKLYERVRQQGTTTLDIVQ